jgi:hypothetical protein
MSPYVKYYYDIVYTVTGERENMKLPPFMPLQEERGISELSPYFPGHQWGNLNIPANFTASSRKKYYLHM